MSYIRGSKGRFAGSTKGGARGGGGSGGGSSTAVARARPRSGSVVGHRNGTPVGRYYRTSQRNGGGAVVTRIGNRGRTLGPTRHRNALPVGFSRRTRIGSPIGGNRDLRYVSRTNAAARGTGWLFPGARAVGRYSSRRGARHINSNRMPRSGYIVAYGPRVSSR